MSFRLRASGRFLSALALCLLGLTSILVAQDAPTPKADIFAGYSWINPGLELNGVKLNSDAKGFAIAPTYDFSKNFGLTLDGSYHQSSGSPGSNTLGTLMVGPRFSAPQGHFVPFVHAMVGVEFLSTWFNTSTKTDPALRVGGGFDIPLTNRISLRLIEGDYVWSHHNFYPTTPIRSNNTNSGEVRSGLVFNFGGAPVIPMTMSCSAANPPAVMAGEPVSVTANVSNIPPKKTLTYEWKSTGGKVTGNGTTAQVDTTGLAPGNYTVTANAIDPKPRKDQAPLTCSANFTINEPPKHPPTAACSANPTTVRAGDQSTISVTAGNPDNRPLTYEYTASGGRVAGNGATATLDTAGANAGPITVTSTVSDDRGLTASCNATVNVEVPPPPPQAENLGSCQYAQYGRDKTLTPARVENDCKGLLDNVALRMQRDADAKLVIIGHGDADKDKKNSAKYAAERAVNAKEYLSGGEAKQQIDPGRIEVRTGAETGQTSDIWLVPAGATFNQPDTQPVDENAVKASSKKPVHHKKAAAKKPAAQ